MLVNLNEILEIAKKDKIAIGSFNTPNLESVLAVVKAAEELNVPVILMHAEGHESLIPLEIIAPIMLNSAKLANVPVCVHLDHGLTLDYLGRAIDLGFTSIMFDGSELNYDDNVASTKKAVEMAKKTGASVEGEIGVLGKRELGYGHEEAAAEDVPEEIYTDPNLAKKFIAETGIDALACSFGTAHGLYLKKPQLDMTVLEKIVAKVDTPLVMHGGSGVSADDYEKAIARGVRKINYFTYMSKAGGQSVVDYLGLETTQVKVNGEEFNMNYNLAKPGEEKTNYFHEVVMEATNVMKENVKGALKVFANIK